MSTTSVPGAQITDHEAGQVARANASTATPVVFVHGLWLLPSSWDRCAALFEEAGYVAVSPRWPDDPETPEIRGQRSRSTRPTPSVGRC